MLQELRRSGDELAVVVDEYGGFAGVITTEDLAEELIGEITDEHDPATPTPQHQNGTWVLPGSTPLDEAERTVEADLPRGDFETLAGLVISQHGSLPGVGTVIKVELPGDPALLAMDGDPPVFTLAAEVIRLERHVPAELRLSIEEASA